MVQHDINCANRKGLQRVPVVLKMIIYITKQNLFEKVKVQEGIS